MHWVCDEFPYTALITGTATLSTILGLAVLTISKTKCYEEG